MSKRAIPKPARRAYQFPRAISLSASISSSLSATIRFSRAFSRSSSRSRPASSALHPAVLVAPAVVGLLRDLDLLRRLGDRLPFTEQPLHLPQLAHDLLRRVPASLHRDVLLMGSGQPPEVLWQTGPGPC